MNTFPFIITQQASYTIFPLACQDLKSPWCSFIAYSRQHGGLRKIGFVRYAPAGYQANQQSTWLAQNDEYAAALSVRSRGYLKCAGRGIEHKLLPVGSPIHTAYVEVSHRSDQEDSIQPLFLGHDVPWHSLFGTPETLQQSRSVDRPLRLSFKIECLCHGVTQHTFDNCSTPGTLHVDSIPIRLALFSTPVVARWIGVSCRHALPAWPTAWCCLSMPAQKG